MYGADLQQVLSLLAERRETADLHVSASRDGLLLNWRDGKSRVHVARMARQGPNHWSLSFRQNSRHWATPHFSGSADAAVDQVAGRLAELQLV